MMTEKPTLHFFRTVPEGLIDRPPLANSLQSFESSLISLRHDRFPEALIQCVTAWESALKSYFRIPNKHGEKGLNQLLHDLKKQEASLFSVSFDEAVECARLRNSIIHYGYTPEDDGKSAEMLLRIGYPFLQQLHQICFGIDLKDSLILELGKMFALAQEMYAKSPEPADSRTKAQLAFQPLSHLIKIRFDNPVPAADVELLEDDDLTYGLRTKAASKWASSSGRETDRFSCPVCGDLWFEAIRAGEEENDETHCGGICFACDFVIREDLKWLTERLLSDEMPLP